MWHIISFLVTAMKNRGHLRLQLHHKPPSFTFDPRFIIILLFLFQFPKRKNRSFWHHIAAIALYLSLCTNSRRRWSLFRSKYAFRKARWFAYVPPTGFYFIFIFVIILFLWLFSYKCDEFRSSKFKLLVLAAGYIVSVYKFHIFCWISG